MKFEYLSDRTTELLRGAHKKASVLKFEDVGTDHLLLALTEETALFEDAGYNPWRIHREVSLLLGEGEAEAEPSNYTPRAKQVIDRAFIEMENLKLTTVTPAILLLSLLSEQGGVAVRALTNLQIDLNEFKTKIKAHLNEEKTLA